MGFYVDHGNMVVSITSPTTSVSAQDLHDYIEDYMAHPPGMLDDDILKPEGKIEDPSQPGVYSQIILVLNSLWQMVSIRLKYLNSHLSYWFPHVSVWA